MRPALAAVVVATALTALGDARPADAAYPGQNGRIAWVAADLQTMNADGSDQTNVTPGGSAEQQPAWSPDGTRIAFSRYLTTPSGCGVADIFVMNADGSGEVQLRRTRSASPPPIPRGRRTGSGSPSHGGSETRPATTATPTSG